MAFLLVLVVICSVIASSESCDSAYLSKNEGEGPFYRQAEAPESASKSLYACSRWCSDKANCLLFSWSPGQCCLVGLCGTDVVTGTVFELKKDPFEGGCFILACGLHFNVKHGLSWHMDINVIVRPSRPFYFAIWNSYCSIKSETLLISSYKLDYFVTI